MIRPALNLNGWTPVRVHVAQIRTGERHFFDEAAAKPGTLARLIVDAGVPISENDRVAHRGIVPTVICAGEADWTA